MALCDFFINGSISYYLAFASSLLVKSLEILMFVLATDLFLLSACLVGLLVSKSMWIDSVLLQHCWACSSFFLIVSQSCALHEHFRSQKTRVMTQTAGYVFPRRP